MNAKEIIARRVARELKNGDVVNLGIGLPTLIPNFLPSGITIIVQSENGFLGLGPLCDEPNPSLVNAGGEPCGIVAGAAFFDSAMSFALIRGGHVDVSVLGALQVDSLGNLANWMVPGKRVPGMGGAMDLTTGARHVIIAMEHCTKDGSAKILTNCTLPLTCSGKVQTIVTEMALFRINNGLVLEELCPGVSIADVRNCTEADFTVSPNCIATPGELI